MTFTLDFQGQILKKSYLRNGMADWQWTKGMWIDRVLHPLCVFQRSPHPWPWPWIFKVKLWKCCISGMGGQIDMEGKWFESTECWTYVVTFNVHLFHDLDLGFSRSNLKKSYLRNGMADWHGTKGMWVDRMLDSHCDFKLWPHPWPWPWIFKVKYWNWCNLGMGGSTHLKWKGAWQIDQPSNGSMWNSYSFQPVGQWMGYSFTDLGAEGCCRSLNALFCNLLHNTQSHAHEQAIGCLLWTFGLN